MGLASLFGIGAPDPASWPPTLSTASLIKRVKAFLRHDGWSIEEPIPWLNVFVRAQKENVWLALIIHNEESLSLPLLLRDCMDGQRGREIIVGILSKDRIPAHLAQDAERMGIFLIDPSQLADAASHVKWAASRRADAKKQWEASLAALAPDLTSATQAP